jgi:hypothetical protein
VGLPATKWTTQIVATRVTWMGQKVDRAVPAPLQVAV